MSHRDTQARRSPSTLRVAARLAVILLILELAARLLPVCGGTYRQPVNARHPVIHLTPNRTFMWSKEWNFARRNRVHVNNAGFVNDVDYEADDRRPLLGVIGDSYVEAFMMPYRDTFAGRIARHFDGHARVYTFAISGSPLSQHLVFARYARDLYRPDVLSIVIVANDFDESLKKYKAAPGHHYFVEDDAGELVLQRVDFSVSRLKKIARVSAFLKYLTINVDLQGIVHKWKRRLRGPRRPALDPERGGARVDSVRLADSKRVVDTVLDRLPEAAGLEPRKIVFLVDGLRPLLYDPRMLEAAEDSYFALMREYFLSAAVRRGFEVVDLQPRFIEHFAAHGRRFQQDGDTHWNALGHELAAGALLGTAPVVELLARDR